MKEDLKALYSPNDMFIFNNLKAFSIFFVFLSHSNAGIWASGVPFLTLFVFCSGYAFRTSNLMSYAKNIIALYIFANVLYIPSMIRVEIQSGTFSYAVENLVSLLVSPNSPTLWYLLAMLYWGVACKYFMTTKHPLIYSTVISGMIYAWLCVSPYEYSNLIFWTVRYLPLFMLGAILSWKNIVALRKLKFKYLLILPLIALCIFEHKFIAIEPFMRRDFWLGYCFTTIEMFAVVLIMTSVFWGMRIKIFSDIGKYSFDIFILCSYGTSVCNFLIPVLTGGTLYSSVGYFDPVSILYLLYTGLMCFILARPFFHNFLQIGIREASRVLYGTSSDKTTL